MQDFLQIFSGISEYITMALVIIVIMLLILVILCMHSSTKLQRKYKKLMRGVEGENLEKIITTYMNKIDKVEEESKEVRNIYNNIDGRVKKSIQNVGIVRYKAFDNVGSDLSFSLALLDDNYDGVIITSIYGRDESFTYAKPINKGLSRYDLSEEEKEVLKQVSSKVNG
ncbi:DUF4446 family protein [Clostridium guangxiense]|uniref:DUF4446 family protein n=1 Tax=Clostridium guangxiense TaxID=1662055 RepID=UPI001E2F53CD|nr:DUF4446 family protein [Clostridium guangxiense]MCD2346879.1 DUF4446 family protein [Clostridium guangxiense]